MLKFFTDTHIAKAVAVQLRNRGVDIVRCEEVGLADATDHQLLEYAASNGRVMVSQDTDFVELHTFWKKIGTNHAGIIMTPALLQGQAQISFLVRELLTLHELVIAEAATTEDDFVNRIHWL